MRYMDSKIEHTDNLVVDSDQRVLRVSSKMNMVTISKLENAIGLNGSASMV